MITHESRFVRIAGAIADFGHPFYAEERQRDVWNEASSFALALLSWAVLVAGSAMVWIRGAEAVPYAIVLLLVVATCSALAVAYAQRLGVDPAVWSTSLRRPRTWAYFAIGAVYVAGIAWAERAHPPFVAGLFSGIAATAVAFAVAERLQRRRARRKPAA